MSVTYIVDETAASDLLLKGPYGAKLLLRSVKFGRFDYVFTRENWLNKIRGRPEVEGN